MILNFFKSKEKRHTIAFYNIENLFDVYDDELTRDSDMTPSSEKKWSIKRYKNKLRKIGYVISNIGKDDVKRHPAIVGLAEVENEAVLQDLVNSKHLEDYNYKFVHYDSPDERGIDVALLYDDTVFNVAYSKSYKLELIDEFGVEDLTRDILLVSGLFEGLELHLIVNHWPSRRTGDVETKHKRLKAAKKVTEIIDELKLKSPNAKVVIMGDFNDDPESESVKTLEKSHGLFNPMRTLLSLDRGTTSHNHRWNLFDQFLITHNFFERKKNALRYVKANIFDEDYLKEYDGKYKGSPYRTYVGKRYKGGYSDHFPVYLIVSKK
ncbi:hypothetical protein CLV86_1733 [Lacinutrix venerupis]|uniref:endonuclease/exonuclease/phosphatase family protein n=1 Tax=Lacinutrix venerupis TaxID=1486034 RepID=UPI000EB12CEE|nr:endonuclease/exonuclease/phosphatase family protein [Lacinutrix venerupis]RLJ63197.1 hypothetical protein CLV86_1733 [Lacinutrix venerupis]